MVTRNGSHIVPVRLDHRSYDVHIGAGLLASLGSISRPMFKGERAFIAHDAALPAGVLKAAALSLESAGFRVSTSPVAADETLKSLASLERLLVAIAATKHERNDPVFALGGGLVSDLAGFAAATYRRGVPLVHCPTTLLAMVDASVGGKSGVNLLVGDDLLKNLVGAFHQPRLVIADIQTLSSLSERQFRSGLAECIKHGMLSADFGDPGLLDWTRSHLPKLLARDAATLDELVRRNVAVKAHVVVSDEHETEAEGGRALLNLGHTFGHAVETIPGVTGRAIGGPLLHGEAVGIGLIAAVACAEAAGLCQPGLISSTRGLVIGAGLPEQLHGLPPDQEVIARMFHDKKVERGSLRVIIPVAPGRCRVWGNPPIDAIQAGLAAIRA